MKSARYLYVPLLSLGLLWGCDNGSSTQNSTENNAASEENTATAVDTSTPAVPEAESSDAELAAPAGTVAAGADEAAASDARQVEVVAANLQFTPKEIKAKPGERLQITLTNNGDVPYSIKFELPEGDQELREPVPPGRKAAIIFTAPEKAGTYSFYSPVTNQRGRGVTGDLIVEK